MITPTGKWRVQVGKGKSSYRTTWTFDSENQAVFHFNCLNTHSGYKKRLIRPDGTVAARVIT